MSTPDPGRHLTVVPKPAPPAAYTRNPLLVYLHGPDHTECTACRWVHAHLGQELCPYHVAWRDMAKHQVAGVGDKAGEPSTYPTREPAYHRGQRVWFQGKLPCTVDIRYWGTENRWRYVVKTATTGTAIDSYEELFTTDPDPKWRQP